MRVVVSWSSGKDSAWTLYQLQQDENITVVGLVTTLNQAFQRVAMHAVREVLLEKQAESAGLPLFKVNLPWPCSNADYESRMLVCFDELKAKFDITHVAYGDLFLEDIRDYRINLMQSSDLKPLFPLWQRPTRELAETMIQQGTSAYLTCIDPGKLDPRFSGRRFDLSLLNELDETIDACGENGEFHTFVNAGPMLQKNIDIDVGDTVKRDDHYYTDLRPAN